MVDILQGDNYKIKRIINKPVSSNCYIVCSKSGGVIIDPGSPDITDIELFLSKNCMVPRFIILTHEHCDHSSGVNQLREIYPEIKLICSSGCNKAMADSAYNLSEYFEGYETYAVQCAEYEIRSNKSMSLIDLDFKFIISLGHSVGGMTVFFDNNVFTGDLIIPETKVITTLKGGDKSLAEESRKKVLKECSDNYIILPGHGGIIKKIEL
ncbi:MBL fold metallo-hydrolase [Marinifilum flexuosum]|uniref:Glyoxylase-like metal-dependent hydrolase (Beta-lactamase superfamily II) n=1 Tax=Marinifilum flexuosum TaxID=1117708 RepID=A0A419XAC6_9BACT|nr:MBL fold metallo-hydrolase [Marinifilum flexuosum]RKE04596.1 glyoxylase-like metal-dependent hydrolase (beta-lactamase superfamily II) [Marinifilum flexuosum]